MQQSVTFTLEGTEYTLSRDDVVERVADIPPASVRKHWVSIDGTRYPVAQALRLSIGVSSVNPRAEFALTQFEALRFVTSRHPHPLASGWTSGSFVASDAVAEKLMPTFEPIIRKLRESFIPSGYLKNFFPKVNLFPEGFVEQMFPKTSQFSDDFVKRLFPDGYMERMFPTATVFSEDFMARVAPKFNVFPDGYLEQILPKFDLIPNDYFKDLLPKIDFEPMLRRLREALPPNWGGDVLDVDKVKQVINVEGIPLVWVPRIEIIHALFEAPDRAARIAILVQHRADVADDCRTALSGIKHPKLAGQLPLILRALDAFDEGHVESAMALATVATETAVNGRFAVGYNKIREQVTVEFEDLAITSMRLHMALAPLALFYTPWWASSGDPKPAVVSRHVSVHFAHVDDYTESNALLVLMIAASVLRGLEEAWDITDPVDGGETSTEGDERDSASE